MGNYHLALLKGKEISRISRLLELLKKYGIKDEKSYAFFVLAKSLALFLLLHLILPDSPHRFPASLFLSFSFFSILLNFPSYLANKYRERLEEHLVPALYAAARMPKGTPASKVVSRLSELEEFGLLSKLFKQINSTYEKASGRQSFSQIFKKFSSAIGSSKLERMLEVLELGLKHNKDANSILLRSAEDLEDIELLSRQRRSQLTSQKITLIASSTILLPAILSATSEILSILSKSGVAQFSAKAALLNSLFAYTLIEAVLASFWLSYSIEERKSAISFYLPAITLLATAVFIITGGLI